MQDYVNYWSLSVGNVFIEKNTHHHRDLSTSHRPARIQLSYSLSAAFTETCAAPTRTRGVVPSYRYMTGMLVLSRCA